MSGIAGAGAGALSQYLFGSLTTVTAADLRLVAVLAVVVLVPTVGLAPQLFAVCADEQHARTQGLPVRFYNVVIVVLAAVTVTLAMRTVGLLLVSALMVVPVAAAQNLVRGFYATLGCAMVVGVVVAVGGATGSYYADTAPGALIVVLAITVFALSWPVPLLLRRRRLSPELPAAPPAGALDEVSSPHVVAEDAHPHRHDQACGHRAVRHGDHTDYLHEGHRHAAHADHYDEH
jgi:zinc transport system permease protein